jgi:enamine deaminase RidA (YjgF/YER057c/UK114 family)
VVVVVVVVAAAAAQQAARLGSVLSLTAAALAGQPAAVSPQRAAAMNKMARLWVATHQQRATPCLPARAALPVSALPVQATQ